MAAGAANDDLQRFLSLLYGDRDGFLAMAVGSNIRRKQVSGTCHESFEWDWREERFRWPAQREDVVRLIRRHRRTEDVFAVPLLQRAAARSVDMAGKGRWLWVDLDGTLTDEAETLLGRLTERESIIVNSGRNLHLYVGLDEDQTPGTLEVLNYRLSAGLGGDDKWAANSLLRPLGTFNHKPTVDAQAPAPVTADFREAAPWSLGELEALLPDVMPSGRRRVSLHVADADVHTVMVSAPRFVVEALNEESADDRSKQSHNFVALCLAGGLTLGETVALAADHPPTAAKYQDRLEEEVIRSYERLLEAHDHEGQRCSFAGCADARAEEVEDTLDWLLQEKAKIPCSSRVRSRVETVFEVCVATARRCKSLTFDLSEYDAAERAAVTRNTARAHVERLIDGGVLQRVSKGSGREASTYRLVPSALLGPHASHGPDTVAAGVAVAVDAAHDVWTHKGLGHTARRIYEQALVLGPCTVEKIASIVDLQCRTVQGHLDRLCQEGFVTQDGVLFLGLRMGEDRLDEAARRLAADGVIASRHAAHDRKRTGYHRLLDRGRTEEQGRGLWLGRRVPHAVLDRVQNLDHMSP